MRFTTHIYAAKLREFTIAELCNPHKSHLENIQITIS